MVLVDDRRVIIDVNGSLVAMIGSPRPRLVGHRIFEFLDGGPVLSESEWKAALEEGRFTGEAAVMCADGGTVAVQWGASTEVATGRRLVLFVIGHETVRTHIRSAMGRLGARSRAHLVAKALGEGHV